MLDLLNKLRPGHTVRDFRSSFANWAADNDYPQELREMALAHSVGDSVEQAYRRSTRINKRREIMLAWSSSRSETALSVWRAARGIDVTNNCR